MTKTKQLKAAALSAVVGIMSPLAMIAPASAAEVTWTGATDDKLSIDSNWTTSAPAEGDTAIFPSTAPFDSFATQTVRVVDNDFLSPALSLAKVVFNGDVELSSTSYTVNGIGFTVTEAIEAVMTGNGGNHEVRTSVTLGDDVTFETADSNTLAVGDDETVLDLAGNELTIDASGGTISLLGIIDGAGGVNVTNGTLNMLAAPGEDFDATVTVSGGEFVVSENTEGDVVVAGGMLKGDSGDTGLLGSVTLNSGSIAPGESPGCINVSDLTLTGGTYEVEINGNAQCTEYDSTAVAGDVDLGEGGTTLDIQRLSSFAPEVDDVFAIITYADDSNVSGYFKGLEDGENVTLAEYTYEVDYSNDGAVTLTVLGTPEAPYTGVGSLITNPLVTLAAAGAVLVSLGAVRYAEAKKTRK